MGFSEPAFQFWVQFLTTRFYPKPFFTGERARTDPAVSLDFEVKKFRKKYFFLSSGHYYGHGYAHCGVTACLWKILPSMGTVGTERNLASSVLGSGVFTDYLVEPSHACHL